MDLELRDICELLVSNYEAVRSTDNNMDTEFVLAAAGIFTAECMQADTEMINHAGYINKEKKCILADYKSKNELFIRCKMAMSDDPEGYYDKLTEICKQLQTGKRFTEINNLISAIMLIDGFAPEDGGDYSDAAINVKNRFIEMTGGSKGVDAEKPYAVVSELFETDLDELLKNEQTAKDFIKKRTKLDNVSQKCVARALSCYGGDIDEKCLRLCSVAEGLKKQKHSLGQGRFNVILAMAIVLDISEEELVDQIIRAEEILKQYKPFKGVMGVDPEVRRLFAIICVTIPLDSTDGSFSRLLMMMSVFSIIMKNTRTF